MNSKVLSKTIYAVSLAILASKGQAQTAPKPADKVTPDVTDAASDETVLTLDPFTVSTDHEGYSAKDTLGGGRVRTDLVDTPSAISVVTPKFMQDLAITKAEDLLIYTNNTEVAGLGGNYSGMSARGQGIPSGAAEGKRLANPAGVNRARGLTAMDGTRNYFPSDIPWDGFDISRVDISRGPNSFLFGTGSPSGIANVSTNDAYFKTKGSVEARYGSFGSTRESLDTNQVLIKNKLAFRLDAVNDSTKYRQDPAYNHSKRVYGALRFDPVLFGEANHTKIQANFEHGSVKSNNPRTLPPMDYLTGYLSDPKASKTGYNPWTYTMDTSIGADPRESLWAASGSLSNQYAWGNGSPQFYYDAKTGTLQHAGQSSFTSPTGAGYSATSNTYNVHSVGYSSYARAQNYLYRKANNNVDGGTFAGAYRNTVKYFDQTLSDPSVFDFYNKLIDGPNKEESQRWNAYNVSIVQSLFHDRLVLQAVLDHQQYRNSNAGILSSPLLVLDLNSYDLKTPTWLPGATTNPDVGRPVVFGDQGSRSINDSTRDNYQITAAYDLNVERDLGLKGVLGSLLGRHDITLLGGRYTKAEEHRNYKLNGVDKSYQIASGNKTSGTVLDTDNGFNWMAYTGSNLLGQSAAGANLSNLGQSILLPSSYAYTVFSKDWTAGTAVDPQAAWTYTGPLGTPVTQVQADNPANYKGYTGVNIPTIYGDSLPAALATGGNKKIQRITSEALLYQGHLWDDTIVPTFGYRRDTTFQRGNDASEHKNTTTGIYDLNYKVTDTGVKATTTSKSYGIAVHLPKAIKKHLPEGTDVTFYYFHGANETPKVRYGLDGSQLPNESGKTDDYSVQVDALDGRFTTRLTYFKTLNSHATSSVGQPLATYAVRALPEWTLALHAYSMARQSLPKDAEGNTIYPASWDAWTHESWADWPYGWMKDHPVEAAKANADMMTKFTELYPQSYWDAYGYNVDVSAIKRGDWLHVIKGTEYPYFPSQMGGGDYIHGEYPTIDQDLLSKGYELETTFRPLKNWDITFNASKVNATQTGLGAAATKQLNGMADLFLGTGVQYAGIWGGYEGAKNMFLGDVWAPYLTQVALVGGEQPEMRKYRFNVISNYSFQNGWAKGFNVGAAFRWEDKAILGYGIHQTTIYGESAWIADVKKPIYGPTDYHLDTWIGYERRLNAKIDWRVQLNLRNVGENVHLVTAAVQPNGDVAQSRIAEGMTYELSTKFSF